MKVLVVVYVLLTTFSRNGETQWSTTTCYMDGEEVSCNDPLYLRTQEEGGELKYGYKMRNGVYECNLNGRVISCDDSLFDNMLGRSTTTRRPTSPRTRPETRPPAYPSNTRPPAYPLNTRPPAYPLNTRPPAYPPNTRPPTYPPATRPPPPTPSPTPVTRAPTATERPGYPVNTPPVFQCGERASTKFTTLITKGERAALGEFPWHVAIYQRSKSFLLICGGSIISPYAVISAAHCFFSEGDSNFYTASDFFLGVAKVSRDYKKSDSDITRFYNVDRIITEGYYGQQTRLLNDIAILQTTKRIVFNYRVRPVCLYKQDKILRPGVALTVAGWGQNENNEYSEHLSTATFTYVTQNECLSILPEDVRLVVAGDKFCVYHANGTSLREGDSGGGLTVSEGLNNTYHLAGIVSARSTAENSSVSIITRVGNFRNWINDRLDEIHLVKNYSP